MRNQRLYEKKIARKRKLSQKIKRKFNIFKSLSLEQRYEWLKSGTFYAISKKFKQKKYV
jgi:hypothetical protein